MINIDFKPLIISLIIVSGFLGWAVIEVLFWLLSSIDISFR